MALLVLDLVRPQIQLLYTNVVKPEYRVTCVLQFQAQLLVGLSSDQLQRFHRRFLECVVTRGHSIIVREWWMAGMSAHSQ